MSAQEVAGVRTSKCGPILFKRQGDRLTVSVEHGSVELDLSNRRVISRRAFLGLVNLLVQVVAGKGEPSEVQSRPWLAMLPGYDSFQLSESLDSILCDLEVNYSA